MATESQLDCATSPLCPGVNLVEASAGTGKTYAIGMLVLRAVVELGIPLERILVVTFTKAATEELRGRIRQRLAQARRLLEGETTDDPTVNAWLATMNDRRLGLARLQEALGTVDRAAIFTIHSFCQQMLTEQALASGQLFEIELLADIAQVRGQLVEDFWRARLYAASPLVCGAITGAYADPDSLYCSIAHPGLATARLEPGTAGFAEAATEFTGAFAALASRWLASATDLYSRFASAQAAGQLKQPLADGLDAWWRSVDGWLRGTSSVMPENLQFLTREGVKETVNGTRVKKKVQDQFLADWPLPEREAAQLLAAARQLVLALRRELAETIRGELGQRLRQLGRMSFDELILGLDRALDESGEELQSRLAGRFAVALIDEFQDTDSAQWRIFSRLFGDGDHYLYLVGDPKQSIYRFRGADIFSYFNARKRADTLLTLPNNHRSHPELVAEVNRLFDRPAPFALDPRILPFSPVSAARSAADGELFRGRERLAGMVYCQLESNPEREGPWSSGLASERCRVFVVEEICRLLDGGQPVVSRRREGSEVVERPLVARDIAILVRSNQQADEYLQALTAAGVPAVVGSKADIFTTAEAKELLVLLTGLAFPGDAFGVKAAMTISWFMLSGNDLQALWQDEERLDQWFGRFFLYHQLWQERGLLAMMNRLLADEGIYLQLARQERAERRIANIHHLLELVQEAESADSLGPGQTLAWLRARLNGGPGEEDRELRLESDEQAIQIVTMHSAKGLQYPVVFCPFLWYRADRLGGSSLELVACHEADELVVDLGSERFADRVALAREEEMAEELRLAYVALTRAELCGYVLWAEVKGVRGKVAPSASSALGYLLFPEALPDHAGQRRALQQRATRPGVAWRLVPAQGEVIGQYRPPASGEKPLAPRDHGARSLHTDYQLSSYSALASLSEQEDHGREPESDELVETSPTILHPGLPAGAGFGNLVHDALEVLPFSDLAAGGLPSEELIRLCRRYGMEEIAAAVQRLLATIVTAPLAPEQGFSLAELDRGRCLGEMEFYFRMDHLDTARINEILAAEPTVIPLSPKSMQGYLTGFVDLFCEHRGRFYILDYKTNHLGEKLTDYRPQRLIEAMAGHNYGLQYWIYTLVLHRYLGNVLPGYEFTRHFGGVFYLFVRGMHPAFPGNGVYGAQPSLATLDQLDQAIGGGS